MAHQDNSDDADRVARAKAIKTLQDNWASQVELMQLQARIARARYEALVRAGFSEADAMAMCHRRIEL